MNKIDPNTKSEGRELRSSIGRRKGIVKNVMYMAAVVFGTAAISFAQSSASTNINVSASVIQGITISATGSLAFGTVVAGTTPASLSANTNSSAPKFTVTANGNTSLTVTFAATLALTGPGTNLTFTPTVVGSTNTNGQSSASSVTSGTTVTTSGTSGSAGNYYFWLGGALASLPGGQTPGNYSGTFTLSVSY